LSKRLHRILGILRGDTLFSVLLALYFVLVAVTRGEALHLQHLVDAEALSLIYSVMLVSALLEESGAFSYLAARAVRASRGSPTKLLLYLSLLTALSASVVMNDTAMFMYVPVAVAASRMTGAETALLVAIIAVSANIGSSLTPIGNPQNIIIWRRYHVGFASFVAGMAPFVAAGLSLLSAYIVLAGARAAKRYPAPPLIRLEPRLLVPALAILVAIVLLAETGHPYLGLLVVVAAVLLTRPRILLSLDYLLLASFALMFIDFRILGRLLALVLSGLTGLGTVPTILVAAGLSQLVSNVPATILLLNHVKAWRLLAYGVNLGGVGLVTGSLANLIAIRLSGISVNKLHKYLLPYFAALLALVVLLAEY